MVLPFGILLAGAAAGFSVLSSNRDAKKQRRRDSQAFNDLTIETRKKKDLLQAERFIALQTGVQRRRGVKPL